MEISNHNGLYNIGNTCYMNSALQLLIHCSDLSSIVSSINYSGEELIRNYHKFILEYSRTSKSISPREIKDSVGSKFTMFRGFGQEDSHEFIINFLDMLEEEIKIILPKYKDIVSVLFDCVMETSIKSLESSEKSIKQEPVRFLSVPVYPNRKGEMSLDSCFAAFVQPEELKEWQTPSNKKERAVKKTRIMKYPRNLIFQLKRFSYQHQKGQKITTLVDIPNEWSPSDAYKYQLKGFVHQSGSLTGGHYTAYIKIKGVWYHFDDSHVSKVQEKVALNIAKHSYLIYYEKIK